MTETEPHTRAAGGSRFRPDVEGLRALAVTLVLLHHAGLSEPSGGFAGVDLFFVVSGFVITMQLLRELDRDGRVSLLGFYGRRAKRLLPAAGVVLLVTTLAAWLMVSRVQWPSIAGDIRGAALYVVNWVFAERSVDYMAEDVEPSPVLHYWSLAVEEQFYVVWPLAILGLVWLAGVRGRRSARRSGSHRPKPEAPGRRELALGMTLLIVVPSLAWSVHYTQQSPEQAFFVTTTRLWQLGVGALVAIGAARWDRLRPALGALLAWAGLLGILVGAVVHDTSTPWPGSAALVPTLGTAAVIVGGFNSARWGPQALLGLGPLVWVGGLSYSLYLWHWPALRIAEWQWGTLPAWVGVLVVVASVVPAWLSYRLVEHPIRHARSLNLSPRFALSVGLNATLVALLAGLLLGQAATTSVGTATGSASVSTGDLDGRPDEEEREAADTTAGADDAAGSGDGPGTTGDEAARTGAGVGQGEGDGDGGVVEAVGPTPPEAEEPGDAPLVEVLTPDPVNAQSDTPELMDSGCHNAVNDAAVRPCEFGDPDGEVTVAVVGDSKAAQWVPAIDAIGQRNGWLVRVYSKSACAFTEVLTVSDGEPYYGCREWGQGVFEELTGSDAPDVVITSAVRGDALAEDGTETMDALVEGYLGYWRPLVEQGTQVVGLSDTPQPGSVSPVYECVAENPESFEEDCSWDYRRSRGSEALQQAVAEMDEGAHYVDMDPWVCPEGTCVGVFRNVLTYRQGSHITVTYVMALAEPLAQFLVPIVEDGDRPPSPEGR